jgi:2-C-methyl-D-erythritol 2,4-cyclodiphosphate synthase
MSMNYRIGLGYDVHQLAAGETLWLGGIVIPHDKGLVAHSDGDVLLHAICDALLGAAKLRDLGFHFPDTSVQYREIDSKILLQRTYQLVADKGFRLVNLDATVVTQKPRLSNFISQMEAAIAEVLQVDSDLINIKATTTEKLGFEGREEGISAQAIVLIEKLC